MRGVTWSMSQNWTICVRYTAHPGMIAAVPYSALCAYMSAYLVAAALTPCSRTGGPALTTSSGAWPDALAVRVALDARCYQMAERVRP